MESNLNSFWRFNIGHVLLTIAILFTLVVFLLNSRQNKIEDRVAENAKNILNNQETSYRFLFYEQQGIDFSQARKLGIRPPEPIHSPEPKHK